MQHAIITSTPVRKCGRQKAGGIYLMGGQDGSPEGTLDRFTTLNPPIPYNVKLHRSFRIVDAYKVLERKPMDEWWTGTSKDTEEKKQADQWAKELFGMTLTTRLAIGECAGAGDADEALAILTGKISYDRRIIHYFRGLTIKEVHELPRVTLPYELLHEALQEYEENGRIDHLLDTQAALWQIAYTLPPSNRGNVVPDLMRMLVLLNLSKDAIAMRDKFLNGDKENEG